MDKLLYIQDVVFHILNKKKGYSNCDLVNLLFYLFIPLINQIILKNKTLKNARMAQY